MHNILKYLCQGYSQTVNNSAHTHTHTHTRARTLRFTSVCKFTTLHCCNTVSSTPPTYRHNNAAVTQCIWRRQQFRVPTQMTAMWKKLHLTQVSFVVVGATSVSNAAAEAEVLQCNQRRHISTLFKVACFFLQSPKSQRWQQRPWPVVLNNHPGPV